MISQPVYTNQGGSHYFIYATEAIAVRIDKLYTNSHYETTGEITLKSELPGMDSHIHQARLNLTSTTARKTLASFLDARMDMDWTALIERCCVMTLDKDREGEPSVKVMDMSPPEKPQFLMAPVLRANAATLLYGPPGSGKSTLAQAMAMMLDVPYTFDAWTPEPAQVLVLDYEDDQDEFYSRMAALYNGLDMEADCHVIYRRCYAPVATDVDAIRDIVMKNNVALIIVDSAGAAVGGNPLDHEATIRYFTALRTLDCASVTIGHEPKNSPSPTPFGSQFWLSYPRSIFHIVGQRDVNSPDLNIGIYHTKLNRGRMLPPKGMTFRFEEDATYIMTADPATVPELLENLDANTKMAIFLREGAAFPADIASGTSVPESTVRSNLRRYRDKQYVRQVDGKWGAIALERGQWSA